jgi:hypothetical protein
MAVLPALPSFHLEALDVVPEPLGPGVLWRLVRTIQRHPCEVILDHALHLAHRAGSTDARLHASEPREKREERMASRVQRGEVKHHEALLTPSW